MKLIAALYFLFVFFQPNSIYSQAAANSASLKNFEDLYNSSITSGFESDNLKKGTPYFMDKWWSSRIIFPDSTAFDKNVQTKLDINRGILFVKNSKGEAIAVQPAKILAVELIDDNGDKHLFKLFQIKQNQPVDYCEVLFESPKMKLVIFHSKYFKHAEVEQHGMESETIPDHYETYGDTYYMKIGNGEFKKMGNSRNDFIEQFGAAKQINLKEFCKKNDISKRLDSATAHKLCTYANSIL